MKTRMLRLFIGLAALASVDPARAQGTAFTYQGRLNDGTSPATGLYDLRFSLHDDPNGGSNYGFPVTNNAVAVSNGLFTTMLDFGQGPFNGTPLWLQIAARTNGTGAFAFLSPRQALTPAPFALRAANAGTVFGSGILGTVPDMSLSPNIARLNGANQVFTGPVSLSNAANAFAGDGAGLTNLKAWALSGNAGTSTDIQFLGTTDNQPLELRVKGVRALRLEPTADGPNLVAGFDGNWALPGITSATIAGGGRSGSTNRVTSLGGTVGGGLNNAVSNFSGTVGGGANNTASGNASSVGGGSENMASGKHAFIGGGQWNTASGLYATVAGGFTNTASGQLATVGGGWGNTATGNSSFAAGQRAKANHDGAFVWADYTSGDFASTAANQFAVRANGGVRLETSGAGLWVDGQPLGVTASGAFGLGTSSNQPLELRVNGVRALRLEPRPNDAPNVLGGSTGNWIKPGVSGTTIAGGGTLNWAGIAATNSVEADYAAIGGGAGQAIRSPFAAIGGGWYNSIGTNSFSTVIAGGSQNRISDNSYYSSIGGGQVNTVNNRSIGAVLSGGVQNLIAGTNDYAVVAGGRGNMIWDGSGGSAIMGGGGNQIGPGSPYGSIGGGEGNVVGLESWGSTIGGGQDNRTYGWYATVPGGRANQASAICTLAAGYRANARYPGSFVWADTTEADFVSTSYNQFSVRATGGARFETGGTGMTLDGQRVVVTPGTASGLVLSTAGPFTDPQLLLQQTNPSDWARLRLQSSGPAWDIALGPGAQPVLNFYDGTSTILALSSGSVALNRTVQFPTAMEPKLNLWSDRFTIGMQNYSMYFRCNDSDPKDGFIWYKGGVHDSGYLSAGGGVELMHLETGGLWVKGTFVSGSDRNSKAHFAPVNPREVLDKVAALPISTWNYRDDPATPHLGPMAQDFHAAFGVGPDDKHIATVDADGVALAAIQGLNQKLEERLREKDAQLRSQAQQVMELLKRFAALEQKLNLETTE